MDRELNSSTSCKSCARLDASGHATIKINKPSHKELKKLIEILSYAQIGEKYGVKGASVYEWIKKYKAQEIRNEEGKQIEKDCPLDQSCPSGSSGQILD